MNKVCYPRDPRSLHRAPGSRDDEDEKDEKHEKHEKHDQAQDDRENLANDATPRSRSERFLAHAVEELPGYSELLVEISQEIAAYESVIYESVIAELKACGVSDDDIAEILASCV